jgi:hypothetical protein
MNRPVIQPGAVNTSFLEKPQGNVNGAHAVIVRIGGVVDELNWDREASRYVGRQYNIIDPGLQYDLLHPPSGRGRRDR